MLDRANRICSFLLDREFVFVLGFQVLVPSLVDNKLRSLGSAKCIVDVLILLILESFQDGGVQIVAGLRPLL